MERGYEYRIYPNAAQRGQIARTLGCCRWVYNRCLDICIAAHGAGEAKPSAYGLMRLLPAWKRGEAPWLAEADAAALQQAVRHLDSAYKSFFRRAKEGGRPGFPRFKSKRDTRQSYRTHGCVRAGAKSIRLPLLGEVKARVSRVPEGRIVSATVKVTPTGKYFCVLTCADCPQPRMAPGPVEVMGVDAGIKDLAVTSDGRRYPNPRNLDRGRRRLAREQRRLARKRKGSKNRAKQRLRVARCHEKVANRRKDALHKATTDIIRESQAVAVEDLNVRGMMANHRLAGAAADASMSEMLRQLRYKAEWYGRGFAQVSRWFPSSRLCAECGCVFAGLELSMREWECPECGARHDRDLDAARNIAAEGARILSERNGTAGAAGTAA